MASSPWLNSISSAVSRRIPIQLPTTRTTLTNATGDGGGFRIRFRIRAEVDPDLDADDAVRRPAVDLTVADVRLQSVQGNRTVDHLFDAGDFSAADAAGELNFDALGARVAGGVGLLLEDAAERGTLLELFCDAFGHELRVEIGAADLSNLHLHLAAGEVFELVAEFIDFGPFGTDDYAGASGVQKNLQFLA